MMTTGLSSANVAKQVYSHASNPVLPIVYSLMQFMCSIAVILQCNMYTFIKCILLNIL